MSHFGPVFRVCNDWRTALFLVLIHGAKQEVPQIDIHFVNLRPKAMVVQRSMDGDVWRDWQVRRAKWHWHLTGIPNLMVGGGCIAGAFPHACDAQLHRFLFLPP